MINTFLQRMIFLIITFSAICITAELFSLLKKSILKDMSLNSFEDILNSNIPIYSPSKWYTKFYFKKINETMINTTNMPLIVNDFEFCINKTVLKKHNAICITNFITGQYYTNKYLDPFGRKVLKIIQDDLFAEYRALPFEYASPFYERFNEAKERIVESGLTKYWDYLTSDREIIDQKLKHHNIEDPYNIKWILIVLIFGYFMAILIFLSEILITKCIEKINLKSLI